jgi:flagellar hook assembly protein FlgD
MICPRQLQPQDAGHYRIEWNGTDENGAGVASGIYFYKLTTDSYVSSKKMMLVK